MLFSLSRAPSPILCHAFETLCFQGTLSDSKVVVFFLIFIYLFLAELGLHCCVQVFSSCGERGYCLVVVRKLLVLVASLVAHRLSCPATCGIFLDQGSNLCLLHWQVDS